MNADPGFSAQSVTYETLLSLARGYKTVVLGGYSGLGYEDPAALGDLILALVRECGDDTFYISGATGAGIGMAYRLIPPCAAGLGFSRVMTADIVSRNAAWSEIEPQDYVVLVDTPPGDWRVLREGESLMARIAADTGGGMIYFGGGAVAESEIVEAIGRGVPVTVVEGPEVRPDRERTAFMGARDPASVMGRTSGIRGIRRWRRGMDCPMLAK